MEEIKLIIIKIKNKLFSQDSENNNYLDIHLRIFCIKENRIFENIKLVWGYQEEDVISPLNNKTNFIQTWKTIDSTNPGIVKALVLRPEKATHFIVNYRSGEEEKTITQPITEKTDLLPDNATDFERVLALTTARLSALAETIISPFDIAKTPQQTLPWLAWLFAVDDWDPSLDTKTQRNLIANSVKIHKKKGTKASIKNALKAAGDSVDIKEWWEEETKTLPAQDYYSFKIYLNINNSDPAIFTNKYYSHIKNMVDNIKPVTTKYSLALKANADCKTGIILLGYAITRLSLHLELTA